MPVIIDLPQVGESVVEGVIGKWLKQPGDRLERFDSLVEVVTDKVTMEVPSPYKGVLTRILVKEGATVPMGAPIAEVETDEAPAPSTQPAPPPNQATTPPSPGTTGFLSKDAKAVGPTGGGPAEHEDESPEPAVVEESSRQQRYSPAVRRLARELGVDVSAVAGTGLGGRVTRADVEAYAEKRVAPSPVAPEAPSQRAQRVDSGEEAVPLSPVRRMIAEHMVRSASQIPHAWSMVEADVTLLVRYRESIKGDFQRREGIELTYLPFVVKAVVGALKEYPLLNSSWGTDHIVLKKQINIGIAVAASEGLIVPVIHDADTLSITGLARSCRDLTDRARQGSLGLPDVQGGTFTVNNTGALGSIISQPIINYPQAGILTCEAIQKRPVVIDDAIAIRSVMNVCLSFDHRIADGREAGGFLQAVKRRLEAIGPDTPLY